MGKHEGRAQPPSGLLPNGLLPGEAASVTRGLDLDRWSKAEERTAELIACIQPNQPSEERRNAVADYVQRLIMKCFPCQVFTFGSVPLKTYLPDGDIDLTAFSKNQTLKDSWAHQVRDILESEEKNEYAEFRVKEVQYIQAEVKIIKCLVENIVVDISFDQLGGLCTLCFLEEVDNLINREHLFKRSIILIKAWCYYESRILGAHHGLISTYALETLVLYIFHIFNQKFVGPLEVLYRFLEFFSKFDWDNFCVSLRGPVPISSLPDVTAEPPRKDEGDLLLKTRFLDACSSVYAVFPGGQDNQGQPFISKHFNVIDPLRVNNNLGRSVSRGNFFRIRSAFAFGAKKLARLLDCPKDQLLSEVDEFFINTWDRHGSGHRPDAPRSDLRLLRLSSIKNLHGSESPRSSLNIRKGEISSGHESQAECTHGSVENRPSESISQSPHASLSRAHTQKNYGNLNSLRMDNLKQETSSRQGFNMEKGQRSSRADNLFTDTQGRYLFARTHSSPELTDSYTEVPSQGRRSRVPEGGKNQSISARLDGNRRKNLEPDVVRLDVPSSPDNSSYGRHVLSLHSIDASLADSTNISNNYQEGDARLGVVGEEFASVSGAQGMHQEQQDLINMMASSSAHGFNEHIHMPMNLSSGHLPLNLVSMAYAQRNLAGMVPANIPMIETPWGTNMPFPHGLVAPQLAQYFHNVGMTSSAEDAFDSIERNFNSAAGSNSGEAHSSFWHDQDQVSAGGLDLDNGNFEALNSDDRHKQSAAPVNNFIPSPRIASFGSQSHVRSTRENRVTNREDHADAFHQNSRENEVYLDDRSAASSRSIRSTHSSSVRSKTSSESSWDGSSAKASRPSRDKRGRKASSSAVPSAVYGKGKSLSEHSSAPTDDDGRDWNPPASSGNEMTSPGPQPVASLQVTAQHHMAGFEPAQTGGRPDSVMPMGPVLLGPGSQQRPGDNSRLFAFYPTGPPVPFVTMVPVYNFRSDTGSSEASTSQFNGEDGLENNESSQIFDTSGRGDHPEAMNTLNNSTGHVAAPPGELPEPKSDILNSDFASHWHNLQYGRFCQNTRYPPPMVYPSPSVLPPVYLQGRVPWDGNPARPVSGNMNAVTQLMGYGPPRLVPVAPFQPASNGPASIYHADAMPRYRSGTGTYLPNPVVSARERHSSNTRRGNYGVDGADNYSDREGNWNVSSKSRTSSGRGHSRNQADKPSARQERAASSESQSERPWSSSYRHGSFTSSYHSHNSPIRPSTTQGGPSNLAPYGMYPLPAMNPNVVSSNGPTLPPVVMIYPYDHNHGAGYAGSPSAEQLEFGSLGSLDFQGVNDMSQLTDGSHRSSGPSLEAQMFHGAHASLSSPDQPSSPQLRR